MPTGDNLWLWMRCLFLNLIKMSNYRVRAVTPDTVNEHHVSLILIILLRGGKECVKKCKSFVIPFIILSIRSYRTDC